MFPRPPKFDSAPRVRQARLINLNITLAPETSDAYILFIEKSLGHMAEMRDCLARHGLAEGRFIVLEQLMNASGPMSHTQLAEQVGVTKGSVTGLVDALERDGYIQREPSLGDRRVCYISITKSGREIAHSVAPELGKRVLGLFSGLSLDEQNLLSQLLGRLRTKEGSDVESI
ncbi:MAG: MarR family transcriptional regulator [Geothrix sp.]|nr:MarR family transcriptional regulator [Geothrix sp.]